MKNIFEYLNKYYAVLMLAATIFMAAFLWWAKGYLVLREEFDEYRTQQSNIVDENFRSINDKLNVIITGQQILQQQNSAQNVLNEQFKESNRDLQERIRFLERTYPSTTNRN